MDDRTLFKLSLLISISGVLTLTLGATLIGAKEVQISDIDSELKGSFVKTTGTVTQKGFAADSETLFLTLSDGQSDIKVVVFKSVLKSNAINPSEIIESDNVTVEGEVDLYKNELEIVAEKVYFSS